MAPRYNSLLLFTALSPSSSTDNFFKAPPEALKWENRKEKLLEEILRSGADIVCLEEVDHFSDFFLPKLKENGFEGFFKPKKYSPCLEVEGNNGPDGCALFYNTEAFSCLEKHEIVLRNNEKEPNHGAILVRLGFKKKTQPAEAEDEPVAKKNKLDADHESSDKDPGDLSQIQLCVAVTHLKAKAEAVDKRLAQGSHLYSEMKEFSGDLPAIICGDFNAQSSEPVYEYYQKTAPWLESSYCKGYGGKEPPFSSWKFRPSKEAKYTIDYIWYTSQHLQINGVWGIPSKDEIGVNALPAQCYPSDHVALCTQLSFLGTK